MPQHVLNRSVQIWAKSGRDFTKGILSQALTHHRENDLGILVGVDSRW
jgi:hypothetical protein